VRREIVALANEVTGGRGREQDTVSRMGSVIARAEEAARGERVEYRGKRIDPRYRFRTDTIVEMLGITEAEMRSCGFRHLVSPELRRQHRHLDQVARRRASGMRERDVYEENSINRQRPWEAEGVSRATWYRRETGLKRCMVAKPLGLVLPAPEIESAAIRQLA
jgi:hypothetical protein